MDHRPHTCLLTLSIYKAWGGNYFVAGGDVKGKQIMGSYPESLDESGANIIEPGILIPTTPWECT